MEKSEINVSELCRKLGITGQTLYRYVSQNDELRKDQKNYSKFLNGVFTAFRPSPRIETAFVVRSSQLLQLPKLIHRRRFHVLFHNRKRL
jgi:transposase-like protein